ncbi:MAG TPA: phosphatase PAP2 family protein [Stellaceae bacterium]|nr:phosphatase PAP2 family protein [Stellaceae bacterium]
MTATRVALFLAAFLVICGGSVLLPAVDLWASGLFYAPGRGFFLAHWPPFELVRRAVPVLAALVALAGLALIVLGARRPWHGLDWRAGAFLVLALALGPGLVVNTIFKDHWGRARPEQIVEFGGAAHFSPPFVPSDQCTRNCSFPAGDPSNGFVLVAAGFLMAAPGARRAAMAGAVGLGALIGIVRVAQGGHFLSDVIASGFLVVATTWLLHRWIVVSDGLAALARALKHPSPALRRFALLLGLDALAIVASYAWLDRPAARFFATIGPAWDTAFSFITKFGVSTGYLVIAALLAAGFAFSARRTTDPARKRRHGQEAWRASFVFVTVAGAGLIGDILKPVFGRARPRLFLNDGIFGFTWHGAHAAYWSFPSGHAITIVSLAAALFVIERRLWSIYVAAAFLVMASRVVLDQHYVSDLVAGAFLAGTATWLAATLFQRAGIELARQR